MALLYVINVLLLLWISLCFSTIHSSEYVPVLMLDTTKIDEASDGPLPALTQISEGDFKHILVDKVQDKNKIVLVFAEESLSPEDFKLFQFDGISGIRTKLKLHVHYYPYVETPLEDLNDIAGVKVTEVPNGLTASNINAKPGDVLLFDLDDAKDDEGRPEMIRRHDLSMVSIIKKFASLYENVLVLYTGHRSSYILPSELKTNKRQIRHLLLDENEPELIETGTNTWVVHTDNIIAYSGEIPTLYSTVDNEPFEKKKTYEILECGNITSISKDNEDNRTVSLKLCLKAKNATDTNSAYINFIFSTESGYWSMTNIELNNANTLIANLSISDIFAPARFSYHCNTVNISDKDNNFTVFLREFQVEVFSNDENSDNSSRKSFSTPYDCIGFTTAPIWSGLFVTFILAMIMTFGLCMIMDIKTMDRFDDPKGKTISINVSE